jgi:hypothetical protein
VCLKGHQTISPADVAKVLLFLSSDQSDLDDGAEPPIPRVINVDKNPAYPAAVEALKAEGTLPAEFVCGNANISTMSSNKIIETSKSGPGWPRGTAPFKVLGELSRASKR